MTRRLLGVNQMGRKADWMTRNVRAPLLAVAVTLSFAATGQARNAPDPLPSYSSLTPTATWQQLYDVSDLIGQFMLLQDNFGYEAYVWNIGMAQLNGGDLVVYKYEFQSATDYVEFDATANLPEDATIVTSIEDVWGADQVNFADGEGIAQLDALAAFATGEIGGGGTISIDPGHDFGPGRSSCGERGGIYRCGNNCTWFGGSCSATAGGSCMCGLGSCPMVRAAVECGGACPGVQSCSLSGGSCGCH